MMCSVGMWESEWTPVASYICDEFKENARIYASILHML